MTAAPPSLDGIRTPAPETDWSRWGGTDGNFRIGEKIWSALAMPGTTLVLEDQERIVALDLGKVSR